jgi:hypothetical protein
MGSRMKPTSVDYAVLWGEEGIRGFRKLPLAKKFAQKKANKLRKKVEIDKIRRFAHAKPGETDWTQSHHSFVKPKKMGRKPSTKKRRRPRTGFDIGL